jgi:hypothetical protein
MICDRCRAHGAAQNRRDLPNTKTPSGARRVFRPTDPGFLPNSGLYAIPNKTDRSVAASSLPKTFSNRSWAISQYGSASLNLAIPNLVSAINRTRRSLGSVNRVTKLSRSRGRKFCPNVDRSSTSSSASSCTLGNAAPLRFNADRIPYWHCLRPVGAIIVSYICSRRRPALLTAPALHRVVQTCVGASSSSSLVDLFFRILK